MDPKDHDLLIELRTEVRGMREEMRTQAHANTASFSTLHSSKLDKEDYTRQITDVATLYKDHENRIRALEQAFWKSIGALAVIQVVAQLLINKFLN